MRRNSAHLKNIHGILLLDKPIGMTSNAALQTVKRLFMAKKAGHTGSLDPLASGMLPLCFGEATKFAQFLLDTDKHYLVTAKLGVKTTTGDAEGEVIATHNVPNFTKNEIEDVIAKFRGDIEQLPSMYSAIKHQGEPLYKLARAGLTVEREKRPVTIYKLDLLEVNPTELSFYVHCSKGTYIRTLIEDIGDALNIGAHVIKLRRTAVGHYKTAEMVTLETLDELAKQNNEIALQKFILPLESIIANCPELLISEALTYYLRQGQPVFIPHSPTHGLVQLKTADKRFLGIGKILEDGKVAPVRILS